MQYSEVCVLGIHSYHQKINSNYTANSLSNQFEL
jgi:hypothetical protein